MLRGGCTAVHAACNAACNAPCNACRAAADLKVDSVTAWCREYSWVQLLLRCSPWLDIAACGSVIACGDWHDVSSSSNRRAWV